MLRPSMGAAATANLCEETPSGISIEEGQTYWIVLTYNSALGLSAMVNFQGSTASPSAGLPLMESADGTIWTNAPTLSGGQKSLLIFISQ